MRWKPATLAGRLLLTACLFVAAALIIAGVIIAIILNHVVTDQVDQRLRAQATSLASALRLETDGRVSIAPGLDAPPFDRRGSGWYWQIEVGDDVLRSRSLADSKLEAPPQPFNWQRLLSGRPTPSDVREQDGRWLHIITLASQVQGKSAIINVSAPASAITDPLKQALIWLVPSIGVLGVALIGATLLQIRLGLRPLGVLRDAVHDVRSGKRARVPAEQPAELAPVVAELNALIDENEERLAGARLNLANMAHGLKTPLASLSLAVRDGNADPTGKLASLTDQLETRIRHHLSRARADTGAGHNRYRTEVAVHLADLIAVMEKIYSDRAITVTQNFEPGLTAACEQQDFEELAGNLIDNAFKWARSTVAVRTSTANGKIIITISDDGPGIPQAEFERVLRPGQRLDETVPGHGFGLSVAQELVSLYGGTLRLKSDHVPGAEVVVELPVS